MTDVLIALGISLLALSPLLGLFWAEHPALFKRETEVRRLLVDMLAELAKPEEIDLWKPERYDGWRHQDSGVVVSKSYSSVSLTVKGTAERFEAGSRGYRVITRLIRDIKAQQKRETELAALKGMNDAFRTMHKVH